MTIKTSTSSPALAEPASLPPLGPIDALPPTSAGLKEWKILVLVTAVNSFSQRVLVYLKHLGISSVSVCIATSNEAMEAAAKKVQPDLVICPFLTRVIPGTIFNKWVTLVVHPGPPGDAGPSSLDWVLLGDDGSEADGQIALDKLVRTSHQEWAVKQRSHWGTIVFQANEHLDGGAIWAWEQYELPPIGSITKAGLYQNQHSVGAISALITAMIRVFDSVQGLSAGQRIQARPRDEWQKNSVSHGVPFLGGTTHERPLVQAKARRPDWTVHTAQDVFRIVAASDSQPGAQLAPLTSDSKTSLFTYGAHLHTSPATVPASIYTSLGYATWDEIPDGKIIATRAGAALFKTKKSADGAAAVWLTHGRVPKKVGSPLEPKIPLVWAIKASGHGKAVEGVKEWEQDTFEERPGEWQEVFVRSVEQDGKIAQLVYWNFYNGAFSTEQCRFLLRALRWAGSPERGNVKILALMGGPYFSNGIALNTIEAAADPGKETWANINGIDDIVEYLVSDTHAERSPFMANEVPLCKRGIITVAGVRGNAAAGGVALAAACDVVIAGRGVVLNPAYRAMGLHGSEFHSFSYRARCGATHAASMLRNMLPQSSADSYKTGLVDIQVGKGSSSRDEIERLTIDQVKSLLTSPATSTSSCAPWVRPRPLGNSLVDAMCASKAELYALRTTPLLHYRNEELSQMLLDSFHTTRSQRYHTRRYKFIRKVKADSTPARYAGELALGPDEEDVPAFDAAEGWTRGEEWGWVGLAIPDSLATSEWTRIDPYYNVTARGTNTFARKDSTFSASSGDTPGLDSERSLANSVAGLTRASTEDSHDAQPVTPPSGEDHFAPLASISIPSGKFGEDEGQKQAEIPSAFGADAYRSTSPVAEEQPGKETAAPQTPTKNRSGTMDKLKKLGRQFSAAIRSPKRSGDGAPGTPAYVRPNVPGDDLVEFPCLYNPEGDSTNPVPKPTTPPLSTTKPGIPFSPTPPVNYAKDENELVKTTSSASQASSTPVDVPKSPVEDTWPTPPGPPPTAPLPPLPTSS